MEHTIQNTTFVIFDVETTGLSPQQGDRLVEVAALKIQNFKEVGRFSSLINPQRPISPGASAVNGLTDAMVRNAPPAKDVLPPLLEFIGDNCIVGHHIKFDLGFLNHECLSHCLDPVDGHPTIDTVKMSRALLPDIGRYTLANVAQHLGVEAEQIHRAMADVEMTADVFRRLCDIVERNDIYAPAQLVSLFGVQKVRSRHAETFLTLVSRAIDDQHQLSILYYSPGSSATMRTIQPLKIIGSGIDATVVGYCHLRKGERHFKVQRMITCEISPS